MKKKPAMTVQNIQLNLIDRPAEPDRLSIDPEHIRDLAASIAEVGLLSPIDLCPRGERYEIISGDCRYQAFLALGRTEIPAFIKEVDAQTLSVVRATENLQRKDLTIIEEARIYRTLHNDHNMSWDQIAKRTGKTPGNVKRRYDLLKLPEILTNALHEKKIGYAVAEELARLKDPGRIEYYLGYCVDHGATQRVVMDWVKDELLLISQKESFTGGGGWGSALPVSKPVYVPCDLCTGPMLIGSESVIRCCPECVKRLNDVLK